MPSFFITGTDTTAETLAANQNGFVATGATLYTETAIAVTITGNAALTVMGTVASSNTTAVNTSGSVADIEMFVGTQGTILSPAADAIRLNVTTEFRLNNAGMITGQNGLFLTSSSGTASATITNSGTITSLASGTDFDSAIRVDAGFQTVILTNHGTISTSETFGAAVSQDVGRLDVINTGLISGPDEAIKSAQLLLLDNTGTIIGDVEAGAELRMVNSGLIQGNVRVSTVSSFADVINSGRIEGDVSLGSVGGSYNGIGGFVTGRIFGRGGNDVYVIDGRHHRIVDVGGMDIIRTTVDMRIMNFAEELESVTDADISLTGSRRGETLRGGEGDDTLTGRAGNDNLSGGGGDDAIYGGTGDDSISGTAGLDTIFAGDGNDVVTISTELVGTGSDVFGGNGDDRFILAPDSGLLLDGDAGRDTLEVNGVTDRTYAIDLTAGTAVGTFLVGGATFTATLVDIENATGGSANDTITGNSQSNVLSGGPAGNDSILGLGGGDTLLGGNGADTLRGGEGGDRVEGGTGVDSLFGDTGNDTLIGGAGADVMASGQGVDRFVFLDVTDSTAAARDLITDFSTVDILDIETLYGDSNAPVDVPFTFLGTGNFTGNGPEVRYFQSFGITFVELRFADSTINDMEIALTGLVNLTTANFIL